MQVREESDMLSREMSILEKSHKVLLKMMENMSKKDLSSMDSLVTYGLQNVFAERQLSFVSTMVDTGKKIYIDMVTMDGEVPAAKDQYGSASVVESFLLRLLCLLKTNGPRLMLLDETFGAVEADRVASVGRLLDSLARKLGIDLLLVTHNPGVSDATMFRAVLSPGKRLTLRCESGAGVITAPDEESQGTTEAAPKKRRATRKKAEVL